MHMNKKCYIAFRRTCPGVDHACVWVDERASADDDTSPALVAMNCARPPMKAARAAPWACENSNCSPFGPLQKTTNQPPRSCAENSKVFEGCASVRCGSAVEEATSPCQTEFGRLHTTGRPLAAAAASSRARKTSMPTSIATSKARCMLFCTDGAVRTWRKSWPWPVCEQRNCTSSSMTLPKDRNTACSVWSARSVTLAIHSSSGLVLSERTSRISFSNRMLCRRSPYAPWMRALGTTTPPSTSV
mmetsp:Transcript_13848/g.35335  ORF Transcript_13848/g.35335 Transcript_13848/m.35335 type:complete len:245 (+) Transcript_13848:175-909(+)